MKKQALAALFALLTFTYCHKNYSGHFTKTRVQADTSQALIRQARNYFEQQHFSANPTQAGDTLPYSRASLHKTPLWDQARVDSFSFGKAVVVPVNIQEPLSIRVRAQQRTLTASQITWLFMYTDPSAHWHIEVITRVPADTATGRFQGTVRIEDWPGHFIKSFLYQQDTIVAFGESSTYIRPGGASPATVAPSELPPTISIPQICNTVDWYGCATIGDGPVFCQYVYTSEDCPGAFGYLGNSGNYQFGLPDPPDYVLIGGVGVPTAPAPTVTSIIPDASITANPIVACVWNHLMSPQLPGGLKSILSSFDDNTLYNTDFTVSAGEDSTDGVTAYKGNNTFLVTLNGSEANDPTYSRIYLAATIIHETFHAKLRQKCLETFGELAVSEWPTPIDDMTLSQLATYFEADSKADNTWESAEHDWMVTNISQLGTSLQQFVQAFYPTTYASAGDSLAPYEALMYMGLQNSTLYQEQVVTPGLEATFQTYWGKLNEGGKCSD